MAFSVMGTSGYFWCTFGIHGKYGIQSHGRFWMYFGEETEDTESRVMGGFGFIDVPMHLENVFPSV